MVVLPDWHVTDARADGAASVLITAADVRYGVDLRWSAVSKSALISCASPLAGCRRGYAAPKQARKRKRAQELAARVRAVSWHGRSPTCMLRVLLLADAMGVASQPQSRLRSGSPWCPAVA